MAFSCPEYADRWDSRGLDVHELTLVQGLLKAVNQCRQAHGNKVVKCVTVEIGALTCVDSERLVFCFDMVKTDWDMASTKLLIHTVMAKAKCHACGEEFVMNSPGEPCVCGSFENTLLSGQELNLIEIEFV